MLHDKHLWPCLYSSSSKLCLFPLDKSNKNIKSFAYNVHVALSKQYTKSTVVILACRTAFPCFSITYTSSFFRGPAVFCSEF